MTSRVIGVGTTE